MRSHLPKRRMEDYCGDLEDVVSAAAALPDWSFFPTSDTMGYGLDPADRDFGDPFGLTGDPLLQKADPDPVVAGFFYDSGAVWVDPKDQETGRSSRGGSADSRRREADDREQIVKKAPSASVFSRMLQISPNDAKLLAVEPKLAVGLPRVSEAPAPAALASTNNDNSNDRTFISPASGMQILSPRNTGIKRRKCQAKKVVCIPAPAPANSRAGGEVVPSDLWAWRKYGQKPIKGSPYPRGYYRCSSSKGCSARKQVERSRTDPSMLVITYTSDHNHPWPTQRNALAGITRSQPSKPTNKTRPTQSDPPNESDTKPHVKGETSTDHFRRESSNDQSGSVEFFDDECGFIPAAPTLELSEDSFLADLGEIEAEPLDELFARGFCGDGGNDLDPFGFYDWAADGGDPAAAAAAYFADDDLGNS